jgi:hypothetical protein
VVIYHPVRSITAFLVNSAHTSRNCERFAFLGSYPFRVNQLVFFQKRAQLMIPLSFHGADTR